MASNNQPLNSPPLHREQQSRLQVKFSIWNTFKPQIPYLILTVLCDIILPLILYFVLQNHIKPVYALLVASSPPLFMVILKALWSCAFDALSLLVFISFAISAILAVVTGNGIILLLEKSLITVVLSIIFAVTLIPCKCCEHRCRFRPIAYYFYQDLIQTGRAQIGLPDNVFDIQEQDDNDQHMQVEHHCMRRKSYIYKLEVTKVYEWIYAHCSSFRLSCRLITIIWSVGFFIEFLARLVLILTHLSVNSIFLYGNIILSLVTALCILLTLGCIVIERKHTLAYIEEWTREHMNAQQQQQLTQTPATPSTLSVRFETDSIWFIDC